MGCKEPAMKARACKAAGNEGEGVQGLVFFDLVEEYGAGALLAGRWLCVLQLG